MPSATVEASTNARASGSGKTSGFTTMTKATERSGMSAHGVVRCFNTTLRNSIPACFLGGLGLSLGWVSASAFLAGLAGDGTTGDLTGAITTFFLTNSLALILTRDELGAEECLLAAFDSSVEGRPVFKESAVVWSRRSVIKCAIQFMLPSLSSPSRSNLVANRRDWSSELDVSLKSVQELRPLERFVFVMSVLESYSDRECALLLGCSCADILAARIRAFQQISTTRLSKSYASHASGALPSVVDADWLECG
jgi:hypothetical protein